MIAYRLGASPNGERTKEQELLPAGPRMSISAAMQFRLPDGVLFCEASDEQVMQWFVFLCKQAGVSSQLRNEMLSGIDLSEFDYRWWVLNEILELGSVRNAFEGEGREIVVVPPLPGAISRERLVRIVREYGVNLTTSRKPDGTAQFHAQSKSSARRVKIYLCGLAQVERGQVTEWQVRAKLEKRGLSVMEQEERNVA